MKILRCVSLSTLDENSKVDKETLGIPLGLGLIVDNVLIEIGKRNGSL